MTTKRIELPLTLNAYQAAALKADRNSASSLDFPLLGLFGEVGTLLSVAKKKQRDAISYLGYAPHVIEELGASRTGLSFAPHTTFPNSSPQKNLAKDSGLT